MTEGTEHLFEDADAPQPRSLGRRGNMLSTSQPTAMPDTYIHNLDGTMGASVSRQTEAGSIVSSVDSQAVSRPPSQAPWMQGLQASASNLSSWSSGASQPLQQRPWEQQLPANTRSADSLSGSSTVESTLEKLNDRGPAALALATSSLAPDSPANGQLSLPRPVSSSLQSAAADRDKDTEIKTTSIHSTMSGTSLGVSQTTPKREIMDSPAQPAASLYTNFSPGQVRHGIQTVEPLAHSGSQGAASAEAAKAGQAPDGVARPDAEATAELEAKPGPQSRGVPCDHAAAAGPEPEWLHDLDEMLPDGLAGPVWSARPQRVSKAPVRSAAGVRSTAANAGDAAGPAMPLINPTDASTPLGKPAVVEHSGSTVTNTECTAILASAAARPLSTLEGAFSCAAAVDCPFVDRPSSPVGTVHAKGSAMAAALARAPYVSYQGADYGGFATMASTEAPPVEEIQSFTPLTSILAAQDNAIDDTAVAVVKGGTLKAEPSTHQTKWGTDVAWRHNSFDREDRCSILERRLQVADARCTELEAELAAKEAGAQLARSENVELAARCERLDKYLAEAQAASQLIRSERSSLEKNFRILEKEAAGHAATMDAVIDERDEARSRCDTLEDMLAERKVCMEQAVADLIESKARCEELQQRVREAGDLPCRSEEVAVAEANYKEASLRMELQRQRMDEESRDIQKRCRQLQEGEAALAAKEQLWAAERPRILGAIRRLRWERGMLGVAANKLGAL